MGAYQLKNEELTLTVISAGAEMKSLKDNKTEQEYLWQADPKFWGRTSPVLFPIVGNYLQKQSVYEGKTYTLSQHGFAIALILAWNRKSLICVSLFSCAGVFLVELLTGL